MITVSVGGQDIVVKPRKLHDYVEKLDFIKMRRGAPWDLIQGFPPEIANNEENYKTLVGIAMSTVYRNSSSVSPEEELRFDQSEEGFFYSMWKSIPLEPTKRKGKGIRKDSPETWQEGINRAKALWDGATKEEKNELQIAFFAVDERHAVKNSDGLPESQNLAGNSLQVPQQSS